MRKIIPILIFSLVNLLALQFISAEEIKLGATLPLSGNYATYGNLIKDGIELAVDELNSSEMPIKVFYEDVPLPGKVIATAINKLLNQDKIHALAGNFWNPAIPVMSPYIERKGIPAFHTAIADDLVLGASDFIFSTNGKIKDEAKLLAEYAYETKGARKACILYILTTFGENYAQYFEKYFKQLGGEVILNDSIHLTDVDYRAALTKVKSKKPDLLMAGFFGTNIGTLLKQARELNFEKPILGTYETEDPSAIKVAKKHADGVLYYSPEPKEKDSFQKAFNS